MTAPLPVTVEAIRYEVTAYPFHDINRSTYTITVERRSEDSWAVLLRGGPQCWNRRTQDWDWEPQPSSRTEEFLRDCRFPYDQALAIAREQAPRIVVNGHTVAEAIAHATSRTQARTWVAAITAMFPKETGR